MRLECLDSLRPRSLVASRPKNLHHLEIHERDQFDDTLLARWVRQPSVAAEQVLKSPAGLDLAAWLDRIEKGMTAAVPEVRWTMNRCLTEIGIHFPKKSASRHSQSVRSWESIAIFPVPMGVPFRSPRSGFTKW